MKRLHQGFAALTFIVSLTTYLLTVQKTVPFWDCAEFTAATVQQQVPHPPGAPLFLMVGKLFHQFIPFGEPAWRVNLVSVFATAFSVLLVYLIIVQLINNLRGKRPETVAEALAVFGSACVGALAFNFSDTLWFNGVESEVYAASTLFVAVIVWLMMRWHEEADNPGHERYLLLIAYLIGLSTGVHLLSILTVFSIAIVVYYRKYEVNFRSFMIMGIIAVAIFILIYPGVVKWYPALLGGDWPFKNEAREHLVKDSAFLTFLAILMVLGSAAGVWWGKRTNRPMLALACSAFVLMIVGYSTYTQILIRSNAKPPMNENAPTNLNKLTTYLGREQYGDAPAWPRRYQDEEYFVRRHKDYGEWYPPEIKRAERSDGTGIPVRTFPKVNTAGELNYLFRYQIFHMYVRYFLWNFVGRTSDEQDAPAAWFSAEAAERYNLENGYAHLFPVRFFALPLIFGLLGLVFHAMRDRRMFVAFMAMFLTMGVLAAIQQNQQNPQPRERDYFYVGSFMVFCIWIGLGVYALIDNLFKTDIKAAGAAAITAVAFVLVPVNMAVGGWKIHDRTGNYMPFDYAYNILQSLEQDAIVFTNGDNDTFSLWYMQDVAGVRRDVRVVNLSLGNTLWYVNQLKNETPWGAKKLPLTFSDKSLQTEDEYDPDALSVYSGGEETIEIPVANRILRQFQNTNNVLSAAAEVPGDTTISGTTTIRMTLTGMPYGNDGGKQRYLFRVQDQLIKDILQQTRFERPVYFSGSVGPDAWINLRPYFRMEGLAYRICPVPQTTLRGADGVNEEVMDKTILNIIPGDTYYTEPHYGIKLRNLNNPNVYFDYTNRRPSVDNFRTLYFQYANYLMVEKNNDAKATAVLDTMNAYISPTQFPMPYPMVYQMARMYREAGAKAQAEKYARMVVASCERLMNNKDLLEADMYARSYDPYIVATESYELLGEFDKAVATLRRYQGVVGNAPELQVRIDETDIKRYEAKGDYANALKVAEQLVAKYDTAQGEFIKQMLPGLRQKVTQLRAKLGLQSTDRQSTTGAKPQ
jgi:hypothetical protein